MAEAPSSSGVVPPPPPLDAELARSMAYCHQVTRTQARNFYHGLKLCPEPRRSAMYAIYAFMRACDDLVDQPIQPLSTHAGANSPATPSVPASQETAEVGLSRIEEFRQHMQSVLNDGPLPAEPFWPAFRHTVRTYAIDPTYLHEMLDGQRYDLFKTSYETFDELYDYCYKVASVVGLVCIRIWGAGNVATAQKLAEHRGIAFQLTNILRDVVEDAQRGRVYIPAQELKLFGYDPAGFRTAKRDGAFDALMRFQIDQARNFFERSDALETYIDRSCRPTSWALMCIYRDLLNKIDACPCRVLTRRVHLSTYHKVGIALRATWRGKRG